MADELETELNQPSESQKRITQLSDKVKTTAEERDVERQKREEAEQKAAQAERLAQFSESFVDVVAANPAAKDHKDEIKTKVLSGYTVEDATYAVLGKAGKLNTPTKVEEQVQVAGGSATITPSQGGVNKAPHQMTRDELRAKLIEAQERGDLSLT